MAVSALCVLRCIGMTYEDAMGEINSLLKFGMKPGLERISKLLEQLGNPQDQLKIVHVAGTNGKGTTCTFISSVLIKAGYRTGLFTSPYVTDFRERFQINGEMIPKEELIEELERILPHVRNMERAGDTITEFELITALAFCWFARRKCEIVVLEVGLGGRFDATNVVKCPLVSVITSISLDHTAILGDTVEQIAFEKCGIIKPGGRTVLYPEQSPGVFDVVRKVAQERGNQLTVPECSAVREIRDDLLGTEILYHDQPIYLPFTGTHQVKNALTALTALEVLRKLGYRISESNLKDGFSQAKIAARMELLCRNPLIVLDGGHNPGCAAALAGVLKKHLNGKRLVAIMGMMADKDSKTSLSLVAPLFSAVLTLRPENPRSMDACTLAKLASEYCPDARPMANREEALKLAVQLAGENGAVIICGSFYLAGELRPIVLRMFGENK